MFTFNDIEDVLEFMHCLFNFFNVDSGNKINANLIKNLHQLQLMSKIKLVNFNIDPDKQLLGPIMLSNDKPLLGPIVSSNDKQLLGPIMSSNDKQLLGPIVSSNDKQLLGPIMSSNDK